MCHLFTHHTAVLCDARRATRISTNQSDEDWHHAPDSCTLEVFRAFQKHESAHFYLALLKQNNICFTFWKRNRYGHLWIAWFLPQVNDRATNCYSPRNELYYEVSPIQNIVSAMLVPCRSVYSFNSTHHNTIKSRDQRSQASSARLGKPKLREFWEPPKGF